MAQAPAGKLVPGNSLITATAEEGRALAITLARHSIQAMQHDEDVLKTGRAQYANDPHWLIAASHVIAVEFATIAAANRYWNTTPQRWGRVDDAARRERAVGRANRRPQFASCREAAQVFLLAAGDDYERIIGEPTLELERFADRRRHPDGIAFGRTPLTIFNSAVIELT
jgi:hypothetical protein